MADEDPYTVTAYRVLSIAVRDEMQAFAFYAYVAAHAADQELRQRRRGSGARAARARRHAAA